MPNQSYSDVTTDAQQILTSTSANPDLQILRRLLPVRGERLLQGLEVLDLLQVLLDLRPVLLDDRLQASLKRLKERLIFLRAAIRGDIGPRTEKLVEYGIAPLRKRGRKAKPAGEPEKSA